MRQLSTMILRALGLLSVWLAIGQTTYALSTAPWERGGGALFPAKSAWNAAIDRFGGGLSPLEERLFADAADGRFDEHDLFHAALIASGVDDDDTLHRYEEQLAQCVAELRRTKKLSGSPRRQAEAIFDYLHRRILTGGYRIDCTDLRAAFDKGLFNCVSASVLFNCLAAECGLTTSGLECPGHAMSRLYLPDATLDVETTCARWFRLSNDPKKQAEHVEKMLGATAKDRASLREVSDVELVAMIYYNRGVDLLAEKRFAAAAAANAKALRLAPGSATARGNLLATINNWAIALGSEGRYAAAADLLRQGMATDPTFETFALNFVHVHHQWTADLCGAGEYEKAIGLLSRAAVERPDRTYFRQAAVDIYRRWVRALRDAGQKDAALAVVEQAHRRYGVSRETLEVDDVKP
jgi:tetratricopeptide (TPR) repeat protein